MNEELSIVIQAITDDVDRKLAALQKQLKDMQQTGKKTGTSLQDSMKKVATTVTVVTGAVTALSVALVGLGRAGMEYQKEQNKLISGFQRLGGSAEQAKQTYQELFNVMGDEAAAVEAAQSLARITTEEQALGEYTKVLTGIYAAYGDGMPIETIAESIAETAALGQITGDLSRALTEAGISEDAFNASLQNLNSQAEREAYIRSTLNSLYGNAANIYMKNNASTIAYRQSQTNLNEALAQAAQYVIPFMTAVNNLAATLLQVLGPAIKLVCQILIVFINWIAAAARAINSLFGGKAKSDTKTFSSNISQASTGISNMSAGAGGLSNSLADASKQAAELKKQVMGFDELNVVSDPASSAAGGGAGVGDIGGVGGGGDISIPEISIPSFSDMDFGLGDFEAELEEVEARMQAILVLAGLVAAGIAAWKILDLITDPTVNIGNAMKNIGGYALIVAGALATIVGYSDAWANGVDWGNLALTIGGLAAVIGGIYLSMGSLAASIATTAAGVALLVLGVKDFIANGPTVQNTILIIGGAIAVAVGLATAGVSVVVAAIVGLVAAVAAFTAAILLEEPAIMTVEEAQEALTAAKEAAEAAEWDYMNAVDASEAALERLAKAEEAAGMTGEELYKQVQDGVITYEDMDDVQRELYKAYLDNEQKQQDLKEATEQLEEAKKKERQASIDNQLAIAKENDSYDEFKKTIVEAYEKGELSAEEARDAIEKAMSEMSDASQQTFMEDLPSDLKEGMDPNKYETTGKKLKDWFGNLWKGVKDKFKDVKTWFSTKFSEAWTAIKNVFAPVGQFFSDMWTTIKQKFTDIGKKVGDAVSGAFKSAVNWVLEKAVGLINGFINSINWAIGIINKIPGVNISRISTLSVPQLARGGVVDGATLAVIGERGKEAVMPLENNTEWMDKLADRLSERSSTPSRIVLMLDGRELGHATINSINSITRQTGNLQLVLG